MSTANKEPAVSHFCVTDSKREKAFLNNIWLKIQQFYSHMFFNPAYAEEFGSKLQGEKKGGLGNCNRREHCPASCPPAAASQLFWGLQMLQLAFTLPAALQLVQHLCQVVCFTRREFMDQFNPKI